MNRKTTKLVEVVSEACALLKKVDFPIVDHQLVLKQLSESALFHVGLLFCPRILPSRPLVVVTEHSRLLLKTGSWYFLFC